MPRRFLIAAGLSLALAASAAAQTAPIIPYYGSGFDPTQQLANFNNLIFQLNANYLSTYQHVLPNPGGAGLPLVSNGAGVAPGYAALGNAGLVNSATTINGVSIALGASGTITAAASSVVPGTTTIPSGGTPNGLLYDAAGVLGNLATGNNGVLITGAGGVPSISSTLPSAVQGNITGLGTVTSGAISGITGITNTPISGIVPFGASQSGSLADFLAGQAFNVLSYGAAPGISTDSSADINSAITAATTAGQGTVVIPPGVYGVCANPVTIPSGAVGRITILGYGATLALQTGCGSPPEEILRNNASPTSYTNAPAILGLTVDGKATTKYVYYINNGQQTVHHDDIFENPAPNATISGSAGVYISGGTEVKLGAGNWILATGTVYNTGNLPAYGLLHASGGNADFTGLIVVNFITGMETSGDDAFGPGTHVWGGCLLTGSSCSFSASLRTTNGIVLNGSGSAIGVEVDDASGAGISLVHVNSGDHMVAEDTNCVLSQAAGSSQYCVDVGTSVVGSQVVGTVAPAIAAAGYYQNIAHEESGVGASTNILNNPQASTYGGEAPTISLTGTLPSSPAGCVGLTGYQSGTTTCVSFGVPVSNSNGCVVKNLVVDVDIAPGAGNTTTFTILDNGVATSMTATLTGASAFQGVSITPTAIGAGDDITLGVSTTAGTPAGAQTRVAIYGCG